MFPIKAKNLITAIIPDYLIQERDGGGKTKLSYISGSTVTDILNTAFDYEWDWVVDKEWIQESSPKFVAESNWFKPRPEFTVEFGGKKGEMQAQPPVAHVRGTLTVHYTTKEGERRSITKTGYGSKTIIGGASEQESIFKSAGTDALKKAASLLGIGLQLYRNEEEQAYFYNELNYEDPWTDEALAQYADEREYVKNFMAANKLDEEAMVAILQEYDPEFESLGYVLPDNIVDVVAFLKTKEPKKTLPKKA